MAEKQKKTKDEKKRLWTIVLYPESAPENWRDELKMRGLVFAVSPLHDKDLNDDLEQTPKKPHYHLILAYDGPTTYSNVLRLCKDLNCPIPKPLDSPRGMYNYFTHKDNPEKAQYDPAKIEHHNGFALANFVALSKEETTRGRNNVLDLIRKEKIEEFCDLLDRLDELEMFDEKEIVCNHVHFFNTVITSRRNKYRPKPKPTAYEPVYRVSPETGEVSEELTRVELPY